MVRIRKTVARALVIAAAATAALAEVAVAAGDPAEAARLAQLVEGAKREGQIGYHDCVVGTETNAALAQAFKRRYGLPESFQVRHSLIKSAELAGRVDQEVKAGKVTVDVISCAVPALFYNLLGRGALMQYESPEYRSYQTARQAGLTGEPGYWVSPAAYTFALLWNPKSVKEELKSWDDVANPRFKGKLVMADPVKSVTYNDSYIGLRKVKDRAFFAKVAQLQPFFLVASEAIRDKVVTGEYPVAFWGMPTRAYQSSREGVELKVVYPSEGVVLLGDPWAILAKAPHANAAKLWIDFLFSKEGHTIYLQHEGLMSARDDIEVPPAVARFSPSIRAVKSIPVDWKALGDADRTRAREEFREIFGR